MLRAVWARRQLAARFVHATGHALSWLYDKFPLPRRAKDITTELTYHTIEHFIVQSEGYQDWLHRHTGLTRLHGLMRREVEQPPTALEVPSEAQWQEVISRGVKRQAHSGEPVRLAVIIPVYKGYEETLACLYSVLTAPTDIPFSLTVINDASPDAALVAMLEKLQQHGLFDLITHEHNQGFVRTVNEGMARHESHDVLLLNADTQVYDFWLERLVAALERDERTASVTPFSNNAELCSYPVPFYGKTRELGVSYAELDRLAAQANAGLSDELPTAVGFCMLMQRAAIEQIGRFDEDIFGRGYGEENDWCLRTAGAGWRHVLAADVFVRHAGSVSFAAHKRRELRRSLYKLNQRHPHYRELVRRFRDEDPLKPHRQRLDVARLLSLRQQQAFLMISHNAGGGTEKHIRDLTERLAREGVTAYRLSPDPEHAAQLCLWHEAMPDCPNLIFDLDEEYDTLRDVLTQLGIHHLHIHHLLGFPQRMLFILERLRDDLAVGYDVTLHDYYFACPSINLLYDKGYFEGEPSTEQCAAWTRRHPTAAGRTPLWLWQHLHGQLLHAARRVIAPSGDTAERIQRFFPDIDVFVQPHPQHTVQGPSLYLPHSPNTPVSVALIGHLNDHKGAKLLVQMAQDTKQRDLPIHFHLFGESERAGALKRTGCVTLHGAYQEDTLHEALNQTRCHAAFFPSLWPETYSYTLSIALAFRLFPVCFDLGAPAERLRRAEWGRILPRVLMRDARSINDQLLALETTAPPPAVAAAVAQNYPSILKDYYGL